MPADANAAVWSKTCKQVAAILEKYKENKEPMRCDPDTMGSCEYNRLPNMHYIHSKLHKQLDADGYDPNRPHVGIATNYKSPEKSAANLKHNKSISNSMHPPILDARMTRGCLAFQHMSILFRCYKHEIVSTITGRKYIIKDDEDLKYNVTNGHFFWLLAEEISEDEARLVAQWYNSDQNQNHLNDVVEHIRSVQRVCRKEMEITCGAQVKLSSVIAKVTAASIVKIMPDHVGALARFILNLGARAYVDEFLHWHANTVNPTELTVAAGWFGEASKHINKMYGLFLLNLAEVAYNTEGAEKQARPQPDIARFISLPEIITIGKNKERLDMCEPFMAETRKLGNQFMTGKVDKASTTSYLRLLEHQVVRLAMSKGPDVTFVTGVSGAPTVDKLKTLRSNWCKHVASICPPLVGVGGCFGCGAAEEKEAEEVLEASNFKDHEFQKGVTEELTAAGFSLNARVKLEKRITVEFEVAKKKIMKDLQKGHIGFIKGFAKGCPVVTFETNHEGKSFSADVAVKAPSLQVCIAGSDDIEEAGGALGAKAITKVKGCDFLENSANTSYELVLGWEKLLASQDVETKLKGLQYQVGFTMQQIMVSMPTYSKDDLTIVKKTSGRMTLPVTQQHQAVLNRLDCDDLIGMLRRAQIDFSFVFRKNLYMSLNECPLERFIQGLLSHQLRLFGLHAAAAWLVKSIGSTVVYEVYANRNFKAKELELAPEGSELKDRLWTQTRSVLTRHSSELHPQRKSIVLDGRLRSQPSTLRSFSLFYVVTRAHDGADSNMVLEFTTLTLKAELGLPSRKRSIDLVYKDKDLAQVPIMFNPKPLTKGTKLVCTEDKGLAKLNEKIGKEQASKKGKA